MASESVKPKRAAKAAALKNAVWLNGKTAKAPAAMPGTQKRAHSPDAGRSSASTKKARNIASKQRLLSKPVKPSTRATSQRPLPVKSRWGPVHIDYESDQDANLMGEDSDNIDADDANDADNTDNTDDADDADDAADADKSESDRARQTENDDEEFYEGQDDLHNLDPGHVRAMLEREGAMWGTGLDADDEDGDQDEEPGSTNLHMRAIGSRVANRLAEVPQWGDQCDSDSTHKGTGTPLSSEGEVNGDGEEDEQAPFIEQRVNRGWPSTCHYTPETLGRGVIKLRDQPSDLRQIIRVAIRKAIGDALHETAYRAVDSLVNYYRYVLWSSARSLNFLSYAKRFQLDQEFGKAISRVLNGRLSMYCGQVKRTATSKVEGYYHLLEGEGCIEKVKDLLIGSTYIYPAMQSSSGQPLVKRTKPFLHPAVIAVLREYFFANTRGGSLAIKHHNRFKSSLPDLYPTELEIPSAMLALVATSIHSALDDYSSGICRKTEFNADLYEDIYLGHMRFLSHIQEGSTVKYHRLMADLYTQASAVTVMPRTASVVNDAIAQLDLDGMAE